jgi:hypothetical protein
MDPIKARDRIAAFCAAVPGIAEAQSGYQSLPPKYPGISVILGLTTLDYMSTEQHWSPLEVRGLLMTGLVNETDRHVAQIDPLLAPLVDAFSAGTRGAILDAGDGDRADSCLIRSIEPSQEIGFAGHQHYGAIITWQVFFRRFTGA